MIPKRTKRVLAIYALFILVFTIPFGVFAASAGDPLGVVNNLSDFVFSLIRAVGMLLAHIGYGDRKKKLDDALDICTITERRVVLTTMPEDASTKEFTDYVIETLEKI